MTEWKEVSTDVKPLILFVAASRFKINYVYASRVIHTPTIQ